MSDRWRFAWSWTLGAVLVLVLAGCGPIKPPGPPTPPKTCPEACPHGTECKDAAQGCVAIPPPGPTCVEGQTHSCWHFPPDSITWLYACPVYNAAGQVIAVINVVGGPAQCPAAPPTTPTCPSSCPAGTACTDPSVGCVPVAPPPTPGATNCDGEPGALTGQTTNAYGNAVNDVMQKLTGCPIGSDCRLGETLPQDFFRSVIDGLRARGICAGQHAPNVTDEIAVSADPSSVREGYHVFAGYDGPNPVPPGSVARRVVWSPGAARPSYYGNAEAPPPQPPPTSCPYAPCPLKVWTAETLPPGWGQDMIGKAAWKWNAKLHTMGNADSTPVTDRQEPFCRAIGMSPMADGTLRASCPMRPDGHSERVPVENWLLDGGPVRDSQNGQDCTPNNTDNPFAFLAGTGNCRICNMPKTTCSAWF
jgi:hypothetical protein